MFLYGVTFLRSKPGGYHTGLSKYLALPRNFAGLLGFLAVSPKVDVIGCGTVKIGLRDTFAQPSGPATGFDPVHTRAGFLDDIHRAFFGLLVRISASLTRFFRMELYL